MAVRPSTEAPFAPVVLNLPVNEAEDQFSPSFWQGADGSVRLFWSSTIFTPGRSARTGFFGADPGTRARFTVSAHPTAGDDVLFDGTSSTPGGKIISYEWKLGDGTRDNNEKVTHRYDAPGRYWVTLIVSTEEGTCDVHIEAIDVQPKPEKRGRELRAIGTGLRQGAKA